MKHKLQRSQRFYSAQRTILAIIHAIFRLVVNAQVAQKTRGHRSRAISLKALTFSFLALVIAFAANEISPLTPAKAGGIAQPILVKYFDDHTWQTIMGNTQSIDYINANQISILKFVVTNPNTTAGQDLTGINFTDQLPTAVYFASTTPFTNTCTGAGLAISASNSVITGKTTGFVDINHVDLAINTSCTITFQVTTTNTGNYDNTTNPINATNGPGTNSQQGEAKLSVQNQLTPPNVTKVFNPGAVSANGDLSITITIQNPNNTPGAPFPINLNDYVGVNFTDAFSTTLIKIVASNTAAPSIVNTCGGILNAAVGTSQIQLTGGDIPATKTCTITVPVTAPPAAGDFPNTIAVNAITYNGGDNQTGITAHLIVAQPPTLAKMFGTPTLAAGGTTPVTFTIDNPNTTSLTNISFTDVLPGSMVVDIPSPIGGNCFTAGNVNISANRKTITAINGTVAASVPCTLTLNVTDPGPEATILTNTGNITQYASNGITFTLPPPRVYYRAGDYQCQWHNYQPYNHEFVRLQHH